MSVKTYRDRMKAEAVAAADTLASAMREEFRNLTPDAREPFCAELRRRISQLEELAMDLTARDERERARFSAANRDGAIVGAQT